MGKHFIVTGGAGFIGSNYVSRLLERGEKVTIYDNLSRAGSKLNLQWLENKFGKNTFELILGDIRNGELLRQTSLDAEVIVHLAGQVAVTTSVTNPREDFDINAFGTINVLEAARSSGNKPIVIYASTNKVYGGMEDLRILETENQYLYEDYPFGISEERPLDFHSPYGCSKGSGDQYVRDYQRIYDLPTVVFRQSCIYGPRQFGIEDQGWVAWFIIASILEKPISLFGDGKQVRDILYVEDLLDAYDAAVDNISTAAGQIYNVGGGPEKTLSVWAQFGPILEKLVGHPIPIKKGDWRPGDQKIYISDIRKAKTYLSWEPKIEVEDGIRLLYEWVKSNHQLFL